MTIIVGLGNPGKKFQKTRHNIGFRAIEEFAQKNGDTSNFSDFKFSKKFNSLISKGVFNKKKIVLAKPQTFMNESGKAVKKLIFNFQFSIFNLFVVHDDLDLELGKIKIIKNRGAAGHKGVQSIIDKLGTKDFIRFRIGIKPKPYTLTSKTLNRFVLQKFNKGEEKIVKKVIKKTVEAIGFSLREGLEEAMNKFNI